MQVCWYFPIEHQIRQLLTNKKYQHHLKHEGRRAHHNKNYMSDVYDTPRWQEVAGKMTGDRVTRIVLQLCVDAFPWSNRKHQVRTSFHFDIAFIFEFFCQLNGQQIQTKFKCQRSTNSNLSNLSNLAYFRAR